MNKQKGQAMVIVAIALLAILGLLALVLDSGRVLIEHAKVQRIADAASLAAVQDLPEDEGKAYENGIKAATLNGATISEVQINFAPPPNGDGRNNMAIVTVQRKIYFHLAQILGFNEWTVFAQSAARIGPISTVNEWVPIGLDIGEIELYEHIRLTNTGHTPSNSADIKRFYTPLNMGNLKDGLHYSVKSKRKIGQSIPISKNYNIEDVCSGIDYRIKERISPSIEGCFKVGEKIDLDKLNIVGPGVRVDWHYGEDPRLVYIPFVEKIYGDNNNVRLSGYGLFYIEYAHYDIDPYGGTESMTEIVGYFVKTVVEGPIEDSSINYGVVGIEYVDLEKLN